MDSVVAACIGVVLVILPPMIWTALRWIRDNPDDTRREEMAQGVTFDRALNRDAGFRDNGSSGDSGGGGDGGGD
ncbi:MAG: hypothetical protein IPK97_09355 [Ahniella sp.]|nr:hypothetical protein [Ahniella sp.]